MSKIVGTDSLSRLAEALDERHQHLVDNEQERAFAAESTLRDQIEATKKMFDGKSIKYVTQLEYDNMSEEEKNNPEITYFITDAVDLSHEHPNKDFLDTIHQKNITIGNCVKSMVSNLTYTLAEIGAANAVHSHDDLYYTKTELDGKLETVDAITLNGYTLWVGTSTELDNIESKDPNTLYFEISDAEYDEDEVVPISVSDGKLNLINHKYQKCLNMVSGTEIVLPEVGNKFTELHLYFSANTDMQLVLPTCKWRVDPNIEEGKSYEIIATYNTMEWLVNIIVYS